MSEVDATFWHADLLGSGIGAGCESEEGGVCESYVFGCYYDHATRDVEGVFARLEHAREIVECCVCVGAADGFMEGGDGVVVLIACAVVDECVGEGCIEGGSGG